jgi:uncharacterized membrane protein
MAMKHLALAGLGSRVLVLVMIGAGVFAALIIGLVGSWVYAPLIGWDIAAAVFTGVVWMTITPMQADPTAGHTNREDPGRTVSDLIVLGAAVASLVAVGDVLLKSDSMSRTQQNLVAGLALISLGLSWFCVHTLFTLRYARLYYSDPSGGIDFNQDDPPRYLDFAYVSFTIGMTFQISDTTLRSSIMRATTLRHALLSYLFGAIILAAAINVVVGIASS